MWYVSEHDSVETVYSMELQFGMLSRRRTNPVDFGECRIHNFISRRNSYTLHPLKTKSLKGSKIQMMHSIALNLVCII